MSITPTIAGLVVSGVPLTLLDTAGIRSSRDTVEQLGVERSTAAAAAADLVIMVIDAAAGWSDEDGEIFTALWGKEGPGSRGCLVKGPALLVANKMDLAGEVVTVIICIFTADSMHEPAVAAAYCIAAGALEVVSGVVQVIFSFSLSRAASARDRL